jgi:hypothetical protein
MSDGHRWLSPSGRILQEGAERTEGRGLRRNALTGDGYGSAVGGVFVEFFRHLFRQTDATVGGGISWNVAGVHADGTIDAHEVEHGGALEAGSRRFGVGSDTDIAHDDTPGGIDEIAIEV